MFRFNNKNIRTKSPGLMLVKWRETFRTSCWEIWAWSSKLYINCWTRFENVENAASDLKLETYLQNSTKNRLKSYPNGIVEHCFIVGLVNFELILAHTIDSVDFSPLTRNFWQPFQVSCYWNSSVSSELIRPF